MDNLFLLGTVLALLAGISTGLGQILEKKAINSLPPELKVAKNAMKKPIWMIGFCLEMVLPTVLYMTAQLFIGPSMIPALMACSLVVLALGSTTILKEKLKSIEILAIALLILGIIAISQSGLEIDIMIFDFLELGFILRTMLFTAAGFFGIVLCYILQKRMEKIRGNLLAIGSGLNFALANLWISPLMWSIEEVLSGGSTVPKVMLFVSACVMLVGTNILAVAFIQKAYQFGHASNLISIQQMPVQVVPILLFFFIFGFDPLFAWSIPLIIIGVPVIMYSSFLLSKRQEELEKIK